MVSHRDCGISLLVAQLVKPLVAQTACRHLHRVARALHFAQSIEIFGVAYHAKACRLTQHHLGIFVALGTAQSKVAVCHTDIVAKTHKYRQHNHRIDATRHRKQYFIFVREEFVSLDITLKTSQ